MDATPPPVPSELQRSKSSMPAVSLVLGILGIFPLGPLGSIPAIICGHVSLSRTRNVRTSKVPGRGRALAGLITGYFGVALQLFIAFVLFLASPTFQRLLSRLQNPVSYEFVIEPQLESAAAETAPDLPGLQAVLARRMQHAAVPCRFAQAEQGRVRLQVGLPKKVGLDRIRALIVTTARLEFRLVHENNEALTEQLFAEGVAPEGFRIVEIGANKFYKVAQTRPAEARDALFNEKLGQFHVPGADYEFMLERNDRDGQTVYRPLFVRRRCELSGEQLVDAAVDFRSLGQPVVTLKFNAKGAKKFASVTADYAPGGARNPNPGSYRLLAIVLDGTLYSAPRINEAIYGGRAEISGNFTMAEAMFLANVLRAGALPFPIRIVSEGSISK